MTEPSRSTPTMATPPTYGLYSPGAVAWATVFGTTVAGGIVLAINYRRLHQPANAWKSLILGTLALPAIIAVACILPDKIPNAAYTVPQIVGIYHLAKHLQGAQYDDHLARFGAKSSNWKAVGIGVLVLIPIALGIVALVLSVSDRSALQ